MQPATVLRYDEHITAFLDWCFQNNYRTSSCRDVDKALSCCFHALFQDGCTVTSASYTLFGYIVLRAIPDCPERNMFPLARASLGAWRGCRAGGSRAGMPPQVIFYFAKYCVELGQMDGAMACLLQFDLYARPSEILELKGRDPVPAALLGTPWGVLFGNSNFGKSTKTGAVDDVVLADSSHRPWANDLLKVLGMTFLDVDVCVFSLRLQQ